MFRLVTVSKRNNVIKRAAGNKNCPGRGHSVPASCTHYQEFNARRKFFHVETQRVADNEDPFCVSSWKNLHTQRRHEMLQHHAQLVLVTFIPELPPTNRNRGGSRRSGFRHIVLTLIRKRGKSFFVILENLVIYFIAC